jgi:hypothetical protein
MTGVFGFAATQVACSTRSIYFDIGFFGLKKLAHMFALQRSDDTYPTAHGPDKDVGNEEATLGIFGSSVDHTVEQLQLSNTPPAATADGRQLIPRGHIYASGERPSLGSTHVIGQIASSRIHPIIAILNFQSLWSRMGPAD